MPMKVEDLPQVYEIEKLSMHLNWSQQAWMDELVKSQIANHFVAKTDSQVVAYAGFWLIVDEANIINIAVHPDFRQKKIGETIFKKLLSHAIEKGAKLATLEVRASNAPALKLYEKYGFQIIAIRKNYYQNPPDDGYVMWLNPIVLKTK